MMKPRMDKFKLKTSYLTFSPHEVQSRIVKAAFWCGVGIHKFIETAIKDRLYEVENAMKGEKDAPTHS